WDPRCAAGVAPFSVGTTDGTEERHARSEEHRHPDEKRTFEHGEVEIVHLAGMTIGRATFRPGWRWSTDVRPFAGTDSCQLTHTSYVVSGRFHVVMDDGSELDLGPGDAHIVPAGHDA